MGAFFIYILKSSVCLVLFYLFFRVLLSKETFHRFNRVALLGVLDAIEKWAADEFRSTNGQLQWIIAEALRKSGRLKKKSSKTGNKPEESEGEQVED